MEFVLNSDFVFEKFEPDGDDIYVIGHTPVQTFGKTLPFNYNNIIFLDTGSYLKDLGGMISCIDLMNELLYQG